jgi:glycosyltransferase involved in cell wall biosynthesis
MPRIALITTSRIPADTANSIQVMKVAQALVQTGAQVHLYTPDDGGPRPTWEQLAARYGLQTQFKVTWVAEQPGMKRYQFCWRAVNLAQVNGADLCYVWPLQAAVFAQQRGIPVILEMHDRPTGKLGPLLFRTFLRLPGKKRLVTITRALQDQLEASFGRRLAPSQVVIAPNGVNLEPYANLPAPEEARRRLGLPDQTTALCTGHLYAGRGAGLFLSLAAALPRASFVWVGGRAEDVKVWQERAQQQGLKNLTFTGFVNHEQIPLYQAAGDVLLMPYEHSIAGSSGGNSAEICSPMKLFEYLAAGRAILSADLPVIREVLDKNCARFCPPEDLPAWSYALGELLNDAALRQLLGQRARHSAEKFTWLAREQKILQEWF